MNLSLLAKTSILGLVVGAGLAAGAGGSADAHGSHGGHGAPVVGVPAANARSGIADNVLTPSATETSVAWGSLPLVNPDTANGVTHYGYNTATPGPLTQAADEARKTEPDKNVYLVFNGHHYLYQGHEGGPRGYVTRIDLDQTDPAKRVSLVSDVAADGSAFPTIDGLTWDPFTHQLLLTAESKAPAGGVLGVALDANGDPVDGKAIRLDALGSGGYEGVQNDKDGNVWLVEDIGGAAASGGKVPNSYVYRFRPTDRTDLTKGGTLEALQVVRKDGTPATADQLQANPSDPFIADLHTYGTTFRTRWVTVHSGAPAAFDATAAAKAAGATPLKRPENGVFRPGSDFREFYFTETGDTSTTSTLPGAFGGVFRLSQSGPSAATGTITIAAVGDVAHTGLDNISFLTRDDLLIVEDAGDGLHEQRDALDSGFLYDLGAAKGRGAPKAPTAVRWLAEGRDASATFDATGGPSYNDGDNEITGIHVSDGDPTAAGLLGAKLPNPAGSAWRTFWTQQHGDNTTWEVRWRLGR
ncbi:alkaline phosphatase PhoX [Nocardioides aquiterrae]|uniref:alkaline phosphatase PhoX n=1 Tax=Nocardioides aquiterrae TaxID=203799 RepID=UPI0031E4609E